MWFYHNTVAFDLWLSHLKEPNYLTHFVDYKELEENHLLILFVFQCMVDSW